MKDLDIIYEGITFHFAEDESGAYFASVPDLDGCFSEGQTLDEAFANIQEALELYVEASLEDGYEVPERYASRYARAS